MGRSSLLAAAVLATALAVSACGSDDKKSATATPQSSVTAGKTSAATSAATKPAAGATVSGTAQPTVAAAATSSTASTPSGGTAKTYTAEQAKALLDAASLKPADVGADWSTSTDTTTDNAAAAAADPSSAASIERCGRLSQRLVTNTPKDNVSAYLGGTIVAAFSQITVFATAAGAADCSAEAAQKFAAPGALARAFGTVFTNPDAVVVKSVEYPAVGDGSFATSLTGDINAAGTVVQLQIVIVAFLKGNAAAVVGVAYAPLSTPSTKELKPFVDLVLQRISANQ